MMDMLRQYFKMIAYALIGIAFGFAFFYLLLNINHYFEVRRNFSFNGTTDGTVIKIRDNIEKIKSNMNTPLRSEYVNGLNINDITSVKNRFNVCVNTIISDKFNNIMNDEIIDIKDVYNFRELFENEVSSICLVNQFIPLTTDNQALTKVFGNENKDLYKLILNDLINSTEYVKNDLLNNSSYSFSTEISLITGKDLTRDSFYQVLSSYEKSTAFLLDLSNRYKEAVTSVEVQ